MQVIRYGADQRYTLHEDWFSSGYENFNTSASHALLSRQIEAEGGGAATNRYLTIFMYLSDVETGGATVWPLARDSAGVVVGSTGDGGDSDDGGASRIGSDARFSGADGAMAACNSREGLHVMPRKGSAVLFYNVGLFSCLPSAVSSLFNLACLAVVRVNCPNSSHATCAI